MPISSFCGLKNNPVQTWTTTKSAQRNSPRKVSGDSSINCPRKPSLGKRRNWELGYVDGHKLPENEDSLTTTRYSKSRIHSAVDDIRKGKERITTPTTLENSRLKVERKERRLTRRETFPNFRGETATPKLPAREFERSKSDPSIGLEKTKMKDSSRSPRRSSSLWKANRSVVPSSKHRGNKDKNGALLPSSSSPTGGGFKRLTPGDKVVCILSKKPRLGVLKYIGTTHFAEGEWCGIVLDEGGGKNDGSVRGVRYFRCRNKHGIFVHSHKVRTADETTLSRLNLHHGSPTNHLLEKQDKVPARSEQSPTFARDVKMPAPRTDENQNVDVCSHPRLSKTRNLATRCRSVSLDRYLFWKAKQLAKDYNMFGHTEKGKEMSTCDHQNRLNRCISLPKMINSTHVKIDSRGFCETSENIPFEENVLLIRSSAVEKIIVANTNQESKIDNQITTKSYGLCDTDVDINTCGREQSLPLSDTISEDHIQTLNEADYFPTMKHDYSKADSSVNKVVHAFSLDTHLRVKNGQLAGVESDKEKLTCQHEANKEDAFIQGRHCSCPSLHSADHFSKAITTCIDLGRAERPATPETTGVDISNSELRTEDVAGKDGKITVEKPKLEHKPVGCSHSQSEVLDKILRTQTVKESRKKSSSSKAATVTRVGSWPQCVMTSNQCLKSHGSSGDIDSPSLGRISSWRNIGGSVDDDDVFDEGLTSISVPPKAISVVATRKCNSNNSSESTPMPVDVLSVNHSVPLHGAVEPKRLATGADLGSADSLSGSQASISSSGTTGSKGKKLPSNKRNSGVTKSSVSKPKSTGVSGGTGMRAFQQSKLSRPEQVRQKNSGASSLASDKGQVNKRIGADLTSKSDVKVTKRHSMGTVPDVKSHASLPRPSLSKRPMSGGVDELAVRSTKEGAKSSKLPVKKAATPLQVSKPAASSALEKESARAAAQRRHTFASSRPSLAPVGKKPDSKTQKGSTTGLQKSVVKGKGAEQKMTGEPVHLGLTGQRGMIASGTKTQPSRVLRSSSSTTAKSQPARGTKPQPSSTSSRPTAQTQKQHARQTSSIQRHSPSKLPRKVSGHSTASDTVSVASSSKDTDHVEELDDQMSVCTEASEQDGGITLPRHLQQGCDATPMPKSNQMDAGQEYQKDRLYTLEMPPRTLPLAPDILSETPCLSRHSVGTQVEDEGHWEEIQDLREKAKHVHQIIKERSDLLHQLQEQTRNKDVDLLAASLVIFSVVRKLKRSHKYTSQLQRKIESTLQEMKQVQERLVEEEANNIKLQEEMMYQSSEHAVAIETLKADYDNILEQTSSDLKAKHAGEITLAIETHKAYVHELKQQHEKELTKLKEAHEELIKSLKEDHRDEIVELESSHSSAIDELVEEHQVEIETIKTEYEEQNTDIQETYNKLVSEYGSLNKKLQSVQEESQNDVEARIQEAIKEYETLPAELESIKTVLEMRNAEIKQLRKEKMEKHLEIEKLSEFNTRVQKLQHENESLSFVVESKSKCERQLSVERDSLRNSLEKETAKSKRLSLENEELQWRLVNGSSPLASPSDGSFSFSSPYRRSLHLSASPPDFDAIKEIDK